MRKTGFTWSGCNEEACFCALECGYRRGPLLPPYISDCFRLGNERTASGSITVKSSFDMSYTHAARCVLTYEFRAKRPRLFTRPRVRTPTEPREEQFMTFVVQLRKTRRRDKLKPRRIFFASMRTHLHGRSAPRRGKNEARMCIVASWNGRGINLRDGNAGGMSWKGNAVDRVNNSGSLRGGNK